MKPDAGMQYVVFIVFMCVNLVVVSCLIYGRARSHGVSAALARRVLIELWIAAALVVGLLAWAGWTTGGNVLMAGVRGQIVGFGAAVICLVALIYVLMRVNRIIGGRPEGLAPERDGSAAPGPDAPHEGLNSEVGGERAADDEPGRPEDSGPADR